MTAPGDAGPRVRAADSGDVPAIRRLARLASAAHDAFVFDDAAEADRFADTLIAAGVAEFGPDWSSVATVGDRVVGHLAVLPAAGLRTTRLKGAMWLARTGSAMLGPDVIRRLQAAATVGVRPEAGDWYLSRIAVDPGGEWRGVGRLLLDTAIARASAAGGARVVLDVAEENGRARAFYERAGFEPIGGGSVTDPVTGRVLAQIHLARPLQPAAAVGA